MSDVRTVDVEGMTDPSMSFPTYTRTGDWVHLSGQVALDEVGDLVGGADAGAQTAATLRNVETALATAGGGLPDVVSALAVLASAEHAPAFDAAWRIGFAGHRPARTTIVAGLLDPRLLIEIQVTARIPERRPETRGMS